MVVIELNDRDIFDSSGPTYLRHRKQCLDVQETRALLAALVQAVYVAEKERQSGNKGRTVNAGRWWSQLGYKPLTFICEDQSDPIIGIVFKREEIPPHQVKQVGIEEEEEEEREDEHEHASKRVAPLMVVAFRGTMLAIGEAAISDVIANMHLLFQQLHTTGRYKAALISIRDAMQEVGCKNISIAGHSLGAALALLAGRTLASEGVCIDTHLFNPPYVSPPLERIRSKGWKFALQVLGMASAATLSSLLLDANDRESTTRAFYALAQWLPHLYVNSQDPICSSYISYFTGCDLMQKIGAGTLAHFAAPFSLPGTFQQFFLGVSSNAYHLLPCSHLHVVKKSPRKLKAHGLHQWWSCELQIIHIQANNFTRSVDA